MKIVNIEDLPHGAEVRGTLYDDPHYEYGLGDVLEVELPSGRMVDVSWSNDHPDKPFRIVVYQDYFDDHLVDYRVANASEVAQHVKLLAAEYSQPLVAAEKSATNSPVTFENSAPA